MNIWDEIYSSHVYKAERDLSALRLVTKKRGRILYIGCGHGFILKTLSNKSEFKCYGLDISLRNLKIVLSNNNNEVNFVVCDANALCFKNNSFKVVIATDLIELNFT